MLRVLAILRRRPMNRKSCVDYLLYLVREPGCRIEYPCSFGQALVLHDLDASAVADRFCTVFQCFDPPNI